MELHKFTILQAHEGLKKKEFTSQELVESCFKEMDAKEKNIHAFISVLKEEAIDAAKKVDKAGNFNNPLVGIPLAIKDNMAVAGTKTTAASKILENFVAPYDATVISRLKEAQAIFIGKTNMDEFACGSSCETSYFGPTKNPYDFKRVPGGSSGGSAASVAANECIAALGSDTGGSIRQPASLCGIVGLKPTYGRVSRYGLLAMASSLDQIGPMTKTVKDSAALLQAIAGFDPKDSTTSKKKVDDYLGEIEGSIQGLRVGVPKEYFSQDIEGVDPHVQKAVLKSIEIFKSLGAEIDDSISLPHAKYALPVYYIIMPCELSSNLERFDGVKYGLSDRSGKTLLDDYMNSRGSGFGAEIRRRIILGTYALSAGYYDAYYKKALKVRTLVLRDFEEAYRKVDCLITPTSPSVAFKLGEKTSNPLSMYLEDIYTVSANIVGIPAISIPCGRAMPKDGKTELPIGLQIMGKHFNESLVLKVAYALEKELS